MKKVQLILARETTYRSWLPFIKPKTLTEIVHAEPLELDRAERLLDTVGDWLLFGDCLHRVWFKSLYLYHGKGRRARCTNYDRNHDYILFIED